MNEVLIGGIHFLYYFKWVKLQKKKKNPLFLFSQLFIKKHGKANKAN